MLLWMSADIYFIRETKLFVINQKKMRQIADFFVFVIIVEKSVSKTYKKLSIAKGTL